MIIGNHFPDKCPRIFVPYKGFCKILEDGKTIKDEIFADNEGPLHIVVEKLSHGNHHTLYNLTNGNGEKLLSKGIRSITYFEDGFYLLEDDNEDVLIDEYGFIPISEYKSSMNVMKEDGMLLSDIWFLKVIPDIGFFRVCDQNKRWYFIKLTGEVFVEKKYHLKFECFIKELNRGYAIFNSFYDKILEEHSSIMWASKDLWEINLLHNGKFKRYFHDQASEILCYAHEILIKQNIIALVEEDDIWYSFDSLGTLKNRFSCKVTEVL